MADIHSQVTRSYNMSRIRNKDTKPEMIVRRYLHSSGFRYRLHAKDLPGKPDIVLPKYRTVIFVNGCFWHGHEGCSKSVLPKTRTIWWHTKIEKNKDNDKVACTVLKNAGWQIEIVWECQLKTSNIENTIANLIKSIVSNNESRTKSME